MKFVGMPWARLFSGVLMICITPLASAMIGSFQGPGYYLPNPEHGFIHPSQANNFRFRSHPTPVNWRMPNLPNRNGTYRRQPYGDHQSYRFRPIRSHNAYLPSVGQRSSASPMHSYRWRPLRGREQASGWTGRYAAAVPRWQRSMGYGPAPYFAHQTWGDRYARHWRGGSVAHHYRFRPLPGDTRGVMAARMPVSRPLPQANGYHFRPLAPERRPAFATGDRSSGGPRYERFARSYPFNGKPWNHLTGYRPGPEPLQDRNRPNQMHGGDEFAHRTLQRRMPYAANDPSQPNAGYVFRPIGRPPLPSLRYAQDARESRAYYPFVGKSFPVNSTGYEQMNDRRQAGSQTVPDGQIKAVNGLGSEFAGQVIESVASHHDNGSLVSQYAADERMMNGYLE